MKSRYVKCVLGQLMWAIVTAKLRSGYSGMGFRIRVNIQGSDTRISGYLLRTIIFTIVRDYRSSKMTEHIDNFCPI